jgi:CRISPR/Cas system-associated exonuclease Cas4 (RecB family)
MSREGLFWDELWSRELEFMATGQRNLRFGYSSVGVSTIAGQFYCEFKVENEVKFGEILTEAKEEGTVLHDELIPTKPITKKEFVKLVSKKEPSYAILRVWGVLSDIRLLGKPDHIIWSEQKPKWLVELKTTANGDPTSLWPDQVSQTLIYGALLEKMGFNCSELRLALVRLKSKELSEREKRKWIVAVSKALEAKKASELEAKYPGRIAVHYLNHDINAAEARVREMREYWLGQREAVPSSSINRCRACEYHSVCEKSLYKSQA